MKQTIRLTESDLHKIIKESVNRILNEIGDSYEKPVEQGGLGLPKGAGKAYLAKKASQAAASKGRNDQAYNLKKHYVNTFNQNFGMSPEGFRMTDSGRLKFGDVDYVPGNDDPNAHGSAKSANDRRKNIRQSVNTLKAYPRMKINKGLDAYDSIQNAL